MAVNILGGAFNIAQDVFNKLRLAAAAAIVGGLAAEDFASLVSGGASEKWGVNEAVLSAVMNSLKDVERLVGDPFFETFVNTPVGGILSGASDAQEAQAVNLIKSLIGYTVGLPLVIREVEAGAAALLGKDRTSPLFDAIKKIPDELGMNFFISTVLSSIFETAVGPPLEERINTQFHPARFENFEVRQLLQRHLIPESQADELLSKIGYAGEYLTFYKALMTQQLPIGDLQTAYLDGILSEDAIVEKIKQLGFSDEDTNTLVQIYITKAQTEAGALYRTIARNAFAESRISEGQFRDILAAVNTPKASVDLEVAALNLQREIGKAHLSVAQIERLFLDGSIDEGQARQRLTDLGYADADINELFSLWKSSSAAGKGGLTQQKILQYEVSGVLDQHTAYTMLVGLGVREQDASFLAAHPGATGSVYAHPLDKATVISAFKDGIISIDDATAKLQSLNVSPEEITLELQVAAKSSTRAGKKAQGAKSLTVVDVKDAVDASLGSLSWALRELTTLGYTDNDAALITAIWYAKANGSPPDGWTTLT